MSKGNPSNPPGVGRANHTTTRYYEFRDYSNLDSPAFSDYFSEDCSKRLSIWRNVDVNKKQPYKYDAKVAEAKIIYRKLEDQFRKSGLEFHRQMLNAQKNQVGNLALRSQARDIQFKIQKCCNPKQSFKSFDDVTMDERWPIKCWLKSQICLCPQAEKYGCLKG